MHILVLDYDLNMVQILDILWACIENVTTSDVQ